MFELSLFANSHIVDYINNRQLDNKEEKKKHSSFLFTFKTERGKKKANDLLHSFQCQSITNTNSVVHPRDVV
jgi:hypothetical protein